MKIVIVYHSGYGHTKAVAESILRGASQEISEVLIFTTAEAMENIDILHKADAIIFGSPTYMGSLSAEFKKFMEYTSRFWKSQKWKNKLAAGFTNSSSVNGDKLNSLIQLSIFAAQHSMLWISTGILPEYENGKQLESPNGMASYLGLMTLSEDNANPPKDLTTAELFGKRIAQLTLQFKGALAIA